jgi:hypothetical protein
MSNQLLIPRREQSGAILVITLMFLVAITLLTLSSMRSSNIGLHMAQNEESRIAATQAAQALADAIVANPSSTPVVGKSGERTGEEFRPPPRVVESSIDKFTSASFTVTTTYDRVEDGLGRQQVTEGVLVLVPKQ